MALNADTTENLRSAGKEMNGFQNVEVQSKSTVQRITSVHLAQLFITISLYPLLVARTNAKVDLFPIF